MRILLVLAALPLMLAGASVQAITLHGSLGAAENGCLELIWGWFRDQNCSFSGGANGIFVSTTGAENWTGPHGSGGFYINAASAPAFQLSTQTGVDDNGVPLNTFTIHDGSTAGDGKVAPQVTGDISINPSTTEISGTFTIGASTRLVGSGRTLAGSKAVIESFSSIVHTILPKPADFMNPLGGGRTEYIYGSMGFPPDLCTGTGGGFGIGDCFASEQAFNSNLIGAAGAAESPWIVVNGGSGKNGVDGPLGQPITPSTYIDIVSFDVGGIFAGLVIFTKANIGLSTTAVYTPAGGADCLDTGLDPKEGGQTADTLTDCQDSNTSFPVRWGLGGQARFDNLVVKAITDSSGEVVSLDAYYVNEFRVNIGPTGNNSWTGGRLFMVNSSPRSIVVVIKPGDPAPNAINPSAKGTIPIAILTTDDFDAMQVDVTTVAFGPNKAGISHQQGHAEDIDGDGDSDLVLHFLTQETGISCGDAEVTLTGETFSSELVSGSDAIITSGKGCD